MNTVKLHNVRYTRIPTRFVYAILLEQSNSGEVHVHYDDIIYITGLSQQTVVDSIKELTDKKFLERISQGRYLIL